MRNLTALTITSLTALLLAGACGDPPAPQTPPPVTSAPPMTSAPVASETVAQPPPAAPTWDASLYRTAINEAIEALLSSDPVFATSVGDHRFDDEWPDLTKDGDAKVQEDRRVRAEGLRTIAASSPVKLDTPQAIADAGTDTPALDARYLSNKLAGMREYALAVKPNEKDPSAVLMTIGGGIDRILAHPYAPLQTRLDALSTRLSKVPALLATARARLDKPRKAGLENSDVVAKGLVVLLRGDTLKPSAKDVNGDAALVARLHDNADKAAKAIEAYQADVAKTFPADKAEAQPIGAEAWGKIASLSEGVKESPADVKKMGEDEIARLLGELDKLIAEGGKKGETRDAFFVRMQADQPKPEAILAEYKQSSQRVEAWLKTANFVTVPWDKAKLEVVQTPPHMRGITFASMNVAGPLDSISDAHFEVNIPDKTMPAPKQKALLAFHARGALDAVSEHEGLPGHYLQALINRTLASKVRKILWTPSAGEGWAHYCEEAVLNADFQGDKDKVRARAFYLRFALQRAVRVVVDVGEADGTLSLDDAAKRLEKDAFLPPQAAAIEARRGMVRPVNMFAYTYGKLSIKRLRDTVKAKEGASFNLQSFHDRYLALGAIPVAEAADAAFGVK